MSIKNSTKTRLCRLNSIETVVELSTDMRLGLIMTWFTESFCSVKIDFDYLRDGPKLIGLHGGSDYDFILEKKVKENRL